MGLPAGEGLAVLFVLCDEWVTRQNLFAALGAKNRRDLDDILAGVSQAAWSGGRQGRAAQVAAMGGETG